MFDRVAIVGVGLLGGSIGLAMRTGKLAETVVGVGRHTDALHQALRLGAIDTYTTDLASGVANCHLVILATPVPQILADIERLPRLLSPGALVTDVGSIKGLIVEAGKRYLPALFVGSHPMAGSEKSGVEHARADLFVGATWALTPTETVPSAMVDRLTELVSAVGATPLCLSSDQHDRAVALTSHLPHLLAYALSAQGKDSEQRFPDLMRLAAGSWASGTRVAHSDPILWQGIALANRPELLAALRDYEQRLAAMRTALEAGDANALLVAFERGHRT